MNKKSVRIAIANDHSGWDEEFARALARFKEKGLPLEVGKVNIDAHDWIDRVGAHDMVIWKPSYIGPLNASFIKEKIYFMENFLEKTVVPNFKSVWHYESKVAQSWLLGHAGVKTPLTFSSFDLGDARAAMLQASLPLVVKKSHGAGSRFVKMIRQRRQLKRYLDREFCQQKWDEANSLAGSPLAAVAKAMKEKWLYHKILLNAFEKERVGIVYWQEFLPDNPADLRIVVVGDRTAMGFWRHNRPNDFRASGSGRLDFDKPIPVECITYCIGLNRKFDFDSMAYDILFKDGDFVINEMSFAYIGQAISKVKLVYTMDAAGGITFKEEQHGAQYYWVQWLLHRAGLAVY